MSVRMLMLGGAVAAVGAGVATAHLRSTSHEDDARLIPKLGGATALTGGVAVALGFARAAQGDRNAGAHVGQWMTRQGINLMAGGLVAAALGVGALVGGLTGYALAGKQS